MSKQINDKELMEIVKKVMEQRPLLHKTNKRLLSFGLTEMRQAEAALQRAKKAYHVSMSHLALRLASALEIHTNGNVDDNFGELMVGFTPANHVQSLPPELLGYDDEGEWIQGSGETETFTIDGVVVGKKGILVHSSNATNDGDVAFILGEDGTILEASYDCEPGQMPTKFDLAEYKSFWQESESPAGVDILDVGFWIGEKYVAAEKDFREGCIENMLESGQLTKEKADRLLAKLK